jgi:hypothetical protein
MCGTFGLYFQYKNKAIKQNARAQQIYLIEETLKHKNQIKFREAGLNTYHFLKYNLDEALIVQPEINIK